MKTDVNIFIPKVTRLLRRYAPRNDAFYLRGWSNLFFQVEFRLPSVKNQRETTIYRRSHEQYYFWTPSLRGA